MEIVVRRTLAQYVMNFETLYGRQFITLNIHNLLHISECVRRHDPFHLYTCFPYESMNRIVVDGSGVSSYHVLMYR